VDGGGHRDAARPGHHGDDRDRAAAGEQRLRGSEEHARLAVEVARLGTWRFDPATGLVEIDERMREIWGESPATALVPLPTVLARIHADDRDRVIAAVAAALDPTRPVSTESSTGSSGPTAASGGWAANGRAQFVGSGADRRPIGFVGTALDIDERKRAEETLRESEFRFRQLADALPQIAGSAVRTGPRSST
jgi:PAS domain-containing protein